jgi:DNA-binding FadR family transcriptional regulator
MALDHGSPTPLYVQLADMLREQIGSGVYRSGAALPPEDGIGRLFGVGRMTVRRAVAVLRQEGLLVTERGAPSRFREQVERDFIILDRARAVARMPSRKESRLHGLPAGVPLLEIVEADGPVRTVPGDRFGVQGTTSTSA